MKMRALFESYEATGIPPALEEEMFDALEALDEAVAAHEVTATRQAAIDIEMLLLDLRLPYENGWLIDVLRLKVWDQQLRLDRQSGDAAAVASDLATIAWIKKQLA